VGTIKTCERATWRHKILFEKNIRPSCARRSCWPQSRPAHPCSRSAERTWFRRAAREVCGVCTFQETPPLSSGPPLLRRRIAWKIQFSRSQNPHKRPHFFSSRCRRRHTSSTGVSDGHAFFTLSVDQSLSSAPMDSDLDETNLELEPPVGASDSSSSSSNGAQPVAHRNRDEVDDPTLCVLCFHKQKAGCPNKMCRACCFKQVSAGMADAVACDVHSCVVLAFTITVNGSQACMSFAGFASSFSKHSSLPHLNPHAQSLAASKRRSAPLLARPAVRRRGWRSKNTLPSRHSCSRVWPATASRTRRQPPPLPLLVRARLHHLLHHHYHRLLLHRHLRRRRPLPVPLRRAPQRRSVSAFARASMARFRTAFS
jgi:hypothetical protein